MKRLVVTALAVILSAKAAVAGSVVTPAPDPMPAAPVVYDWSGPYAGTFAGIGWGSMDYTPGPAWTIGRDLTYGGFAGYLLQSGSYVYGGELAATRVEGVPNGFVTESFDVIIDAKLRGGMAWDNVLAYGFAGGSLGHYTIAPGVEWMLYGANFGAGVEYGVTEDFSFGVEYVGRYLQGDTNIPGQVQANWLHAVEARATLRF